MSDTEKRLFDLSVKYSRADWVKSTFITDEQKQFPPTRTKELIAATRNSLTNPADLRDLICLTTLRARSALELSLTLPAPKDPAERDELTQLAASLEATTARANCPDGDNGKCLSLGELEEILGE